MLRGRPGETGVAAKWGRVPLLAALLSGLQAGFPFYGVSSVGRCPVLPAVGVILLPRAIPGEAVAKESHRSLDSSRPVGRGGPIRLAPDAHFNQPA